MSFHLLCRLSSSGLTLIIVPVIAPGGCASVSLKINLTLSCVTGLNFRSWYLTDLADFALMFQVNQCESGDK